MRWLISALLLFTACCSRASAERYHITAVYPKAVGLDFVGNINNRGAVAVTVSYPPYYDPATASFWLDGQLPSLGTLGGGRSRADGINNLGQSTGSALTRGQVYHAFRTKPYAGISSPNDDLGTLIGPDGDSYGRAINDAGVVAGLSRDTDGHWHACVWQPGHAAARLPDPPPPGPDYTTGAADTIDGINARGDIVGIFTFFKPPSSGTSMGVLWPGGGAASALTAPGGGDSVWPAGINDAGQVVGYTNITPPGGDTALPRACVVGGGASTLLPMLGGDRAAATAINNKGWVVGWSLIDSGEQHAFVWDSVRGTRDLNDLIPPDSGWLLTSALAINNRGMIVAVGKSATLGTRFLILQSAVYAIDLSLYAGEPALATWLKIKTDLARDMVVVGGWGGQHRNVHAHNQSLFARQAGLKTSAFTLLNFKGPEDGRCQVREALAALGDEARYLSFMAIDVEDAWLPPGLKHHPPVAADQQRALARIREAVAEVRDQGLHPAIYTSDIYWVPYTADSHEFADVPLWQPVSDQKDDLEDPALSGAASFGGWAERAGKQYDVDTPTHRVRLDGLPNMPVDLDIFDAGLLANDNPGFESATDLQLAEPKVKRTGRQLTVTMTITNAGNLDAHEVSLDSATLGGTATSSRLPPFLTQPGHHPGDIFVCQSSGAVALKFPGTVGQRGATVHFEIEVAQAGAHLTLGVDMVLP